MHDDAAMQNFHFVSKLLFSTFFSSRIMDMSSLQGGAFLSNFSCAYPGTCSTVVRSPDGYRRTSELSKISQDTLNLFHILVWFHGLNGLYII